MISQKTLSGDQPANISKFDELVNLSENSYQRIDAHINNICELIEKFLKQFVKYFQCDYKYIDFYRADTKEKCPANSYYKKFIAIDDNGAVSFKLLVTIPDKSNENILNRLDADTNIAKYLTPSQIVFNVKIRKNQNEKFTICIEEHKEFLIRFDSENMFEQIFDYLFELMKNSLEYRWG